MSTSLPVLVVSAAMRRSDGAVITSPRHWDNVCRDTADRDVNPDSWFGAEQGFVDQRGVFLSREEAWRVAEAAGQIRRRVGGDTRNGGTLYSENLY